MTSEEKFLLPRDLVKTKEIEEALRPYSGGDLSFQEWERLYDAEVAKLRRLRRNQKLLRWVPGLLRTQKSVKLNYDIQWAKFKAESQVNTDGSLVPVQWLDRRFLARAVSTKRIHLLYLMRIIEASRPALVLEVGSGNGLNLVELATQFPGIFFSGLELTPKGVEASNSLAKKSPLPESILAFSPLPPVRNNALGTIDFNEGDASKMPFPDGTFDLVYTSLALEQMEEVRESALREIVRVSKRWVVLIEPFRDFNDAGLRRLYIDANRYFAGRIRDLGRYGLEPLQVFEHIPHKMTLKVAIVVALKK